MEEYSLGDIKDILVDADDDEEKEEEKGNCPTPDKSHFTVHSQQHNPSKSRLSLSSTICPLIIFGLNITLSTLFNTVVHCFRCLY